MNNELDFDVEYEVNFEVENNVLEQYYITQLSVDMAKEVHEELIKFLTQADWALIENNEYISTEMLLDHVTSTPNQSVYNDYERAMALIG